MKEICKCGVCTDSGTLTFQAKHQCQHWIEPGYWRCHANARRKRNYCAQHLYPRQAKDAADDRKKMAVALREQGLTWMEIGEFFGLTGTTARWMVMEGEQLLASEALRFHRMRTRHELSA